MPTLLHRAPDFRSSKLHACLFQRHKVRRAPLQVTPISEEDYFAKNPEFSSWLRDCQRVHFNELAAEDARERFKVPVARDACVAPCCPE